MLCRLTKRTLTRPNVYLQMDPDKGRLNQYKYKGRDEESARGKRRDFAVKLRKDKREQKVCHL